MKKLIIFSILSLPFFLACNQTEKQENAEKIILAFHPEKGTKKEMEYHITFESPSNKAELNYDMNLSMEIIGFDEKSTDVKYTFNEVNFSGFIDTMKINLNAASPDSSQSMFFVYAEPYFICYNRQFLVKYDRKMGKISDDLISPKDPKSLTDPVNKAPLFTTLPDSEIETGTRWKDKVELKAGQGMVVTAEFEVKKIEKNIAYIDFSGKLDGKGEGFGQNFSLAGNVSGSLEVDIVSGLTLHSEMVQDLTQIMSEKEMPLKITIKQHIK